MILPDINLLVYAYNRDAPGHVKARAWWESALSSPEAVGLPWAVLLGYLRVMTHPRILLRPASPIRAIEHIRSWLEQSSVQVLHPGPRHLEILESLLAHTTVAGNLTTDLHLAALAIEYQAVLHSNDADFSRFPGLRWRNPIR